MNRDALNELYDYTTFTWQAYGNAVRTLPGDAFARELRGTGWTSLREVLFHLALAWDGWLCEQLRIDDPLDATPESTASWDELQAHRHKVRGWLRRVIDGTSDDELQARTAPMWQDTPAAMMTSKAEILAHILLHERGHHGDVSTALAQAGANPPDVDYLVYVFFKSRRRPSA